MKIYKIIIPNDFKDFYGFCKSLKKTGWYTLDSQCVFLLAEEDKKNTLAKKYNIKVLEILDYNAEIKNASIKKMVAQEIFNHSQKIIKEEAQERITAMYNILQNANKIIKEGVITESVDKKE